MSLSCSLAWRQPGHVPDHWPCHSWAPTQQLCVGLGVEEGKEVKKGSSLDKVKTRAGVGVCLCVSEQTCAHG